MVEGQGGLAALFGKERPAEHRWAKAHVEGLVQMNVRCRIPLPLSPHCQQHQR